MRIVCLIGVIALLWTATTGAFSQTNASPPKYIFAKINGQSFGATVGEANPYINAAGRVMLPIRFVTYMNISYDQLQQNFNNWSAEVITDTRRLKLKVSDNQLQVNERTITMDSVPERVRESIFVPARAIAEALGANVHFQHATKTVHILF